MYFKRLLDEHAGIVDSEKRTSGRPAIGTICSYVPVEILHSFGILPVRIWGQAEDMHRADGLLQPYICPPARNLMAMGLEGRYNFLDGIVHCYTCDATCGLYNVWVRNLKPGFSHMVSLPYVNTPESREYAMAEFGVLIEKLESFTGDAFSADSLAESITLYNSQRELIREVYELKAGGSPIEYTDVYSLNVCSQVLPVEMMTDELTGFLEEARNMERAVGGRRVLLSGSVVTDMQLMEFIESKGTGIVADDTCLGLRLLDSRIPDGPPLESLVEYYLSRPPCASRSDFPSRRRFLLETLEANDIDAVIFVHQKFCDPHLSDHPFLKEVLDEVDVPSLQVELEGEGFTGQVRMRIESFFEMLETG